MFFHRPCFAALLVHRYVALFLWESELFFGFGCHDGSVCSLNRGNVQECSPFYCKWCCEKVQWMTCDYFLC